MAHGAGGHNTIGSGVDGPLDDFIDHGFDHFWPGNRQKGSATARGKRPFFCLCAQIGQDLFTSVFQVSVSD
jgi:hypothetical protein